MHQHKKTLNKLALILGVFVILVAPVILFSQPLVYEPLVKIPGLNDTSSSDLSSFVNKAYAFSISIAALLAVIKIIIAGVKWMMTDKVGSISEAKSDIQSALIGLLIIISAVLIINIINPDILS